MKKIALFLSVILLFAIAVSCSIQTRQDQVLSSLGKCESEQIWTHGEFQDYTDFGIYTYSSANLDNNSYFSKVSESDIETICTFVENFEQWINTFRYNDTNDDLVLNYTFERSTIDTEDFFYIYEDEDYSKFGCYDVWFYDSQTNTLYYLHNNS